MDYTSAKHIEQPRLVVQGLQHFVDTVGADRVIGRVECSFGTFAGFGRVRPDICWAKPGSLVEGAALATSG